MASSLLLTVATLTTVAHAAFSTTFFTNTSSHAPCPGQQFSCTAPNGICAYDRTLNSYYCCEPDDASGQCWHGAVKCGGSGTISCGSGSNTWCCLGGGEEMCTLKTGQINICWSTQNNPLGNTSLRALTDSYHSLSSANPSAPTQSVNLTSLASSTTTGASSSPTSSTNQSSSTSAPSSTSSASTTSASTSTVSGGAIAGIIIGVLALLALAISLTLLLLRRRRQLQNKKAFVNDHQSQYPGFLPSSTPPPPTTAAAIFGGGVGGHEYYAPVSQHLPSDEKAAMMATTTTAGTTTAYVPEAQIIQHHELTADADRAELPAPESQQPPRLQRPNQPGQEVVELPSHGQLR